MATFRLGRFTLLSLVLLPALASAQGRFGRGRGPGKLQREEGVSVPTVVNPVNLLLAHRQDLALTDSQFMHVIAIKRLLDSTNAPFMRRLDSVQHLFKGGKPIFSDPSVARRDSLAEARAVVAETVAGVRSNISDARGQAYALLAPAQLDKARQFEADAEKALEDERQKSGARGSP